MLKRQNWQCHLPSESELAYIYSKTSYTEVYLYTQDLCFSIYSASINIIITLYPVHETYIIVQE